MVPLTLLAAQKVLNVLTSGNALANSLSAITTTGYVQLPAINNSQVTLSSVAPEIADMNVQLTYPRVCVYSGTINNAQNEKFRSFSGTVGVQVAIWASADMATATDLWIQYYVEAVSSVLRRNIGDWGDGVFFGGKYDIKIQGPKAGGYGFVQQGVLTCSLDVSLQ